MIAPIYHELSEKLEAYITENKLSGRLPGLGKLSREFGVHQVTMSKAVKLLEEKGLCIVNGTRGTFITEKRSARPVHHMIGIFGLNHMGKRDNFITGLNQATHNSGYTAIGMSIAPNFFAREPEILSSFPVDGFLFCTSSLTAKMAEYLRSVNLPFVACNRFPGLPWANTVDFDHEAIMRSSLTYLRKLGHRRIAYISPQVVEEYRHHTVWMKGIYQELMGNDFDNDLFLDFPVKWLELINQEKTAPEVTKVIRRIAGMSEPPTAIITSPRLCLEFRGQFQAAGIQVPEDISLFSYGSSLDDRQHQMAGIEFDYEKLWQHGLNHLLRLLGTPDAPVRHDLLRMPVKNGITSAAPSHSIFTLRDKFFNQDLIVNNNHKESENV